ncbi:hypothetical protein QUA20_27325 [Microcoleus sp. Pol7_A1]|uniref:hypothetical protein n=1 Tax=Microcoleus sp. Pol7_A1 TaxID=2818893 RepID=UPI002FCE9BBF
MVCLPLLDVKFNFAVAVGTIGLFKNKYLFVPARRDRRYHLARCCLAASLVAVAVMKN